MPVFWSGLILLYIFSVKLGWLPGPGRLDARTTRRRSITGLLHVDALLAGDLGALRRCAAPPCPARLRARLGRDGHHLAAGAGQHARRAGAGLHPGGPRASGAGELRVLLHHALRNALIPTLTIIGFSFAYLITGAVLTETIFAWPGIGSYAVDAARSLDYPADHRRDDRRRRRPSCSPTS